MKTIKIKNPETIKEQYREFSVVEVEECFSYFTTHFMLEQKYEKEQPFKMVTRRHGKLTVDGEVVMKVYLHSPNHDMNLEMVIEYAPCMEKTIYEHCHLWLNLEVLPFEATTREAKKQLETWRRERIG